MRGFSTVHGSRQSSSSNGATPGAPKGQPADPGLWWGRGAAGERGSHGVEFRAASVLAHPGRVHHAGGAEQLAAAPQPGQSGPGGFRVAGGRAAHHSPQRLSPGSGAPRHRPRRVAGWHA